MKSDDKSIACWRVQVRGRVQGVGFRDACMHRAQFVGVTGWVRNRVDASVELMLQGSSQQLQEMTDWLRHNVPGARVDGLDITEVAQPFDRLDRFERRPTA